MGQKWPKTVLNTRVVPAHRPRANQLLAVLSRFAHPRPHFGLIVGQTMSWPYLGYVAQNAIPRSLSRVITPTSGGFHTSKWPTYTPRPEFWAVAALVAFMDQGPRGWQCIAPPPPPGGAGGGGARGGGGGF